MIPLEEPVSREIEGCRMNGLVAQRFSVDERYLYVTFASTGRRSYVLENGYSCDSGDTIDGRIVGMPSVRTVPSERWRRSRRAAQVRHGDRAGTRSGREILWNMDFPESAPPADAGLVIASTIGQG